MFVCPECGRRYEAGGFCGDDGGRLADAAGDTLLGATVGRWRLTRVLGEGGMGRVYLGLNPSIGSRVAVKVLSESCARERELVDRFFAEARAVNVIQHESIVSVIDLERLDDGRPYIVMEFIAGTTLSGLIRGGPLPLGSVARLIGEVLSALAAAHAHGIVHRDLKPDNVLVTAEGRAKVLDFGIAKLAPGLRVEQSPRTRTGALLGTPAYMAPEQIAGAAVDPRTDVYAAGVMLFETVTGRRPFHFEGLYELLRAQVEEAPPSARALRPDLPAAYEAVIVKAMAKAPHDRFAGVAEMAQALAAATAELPAEAWAPLRGAGRGGGLGAMTPSRPLFDHDPTDRDPRVPGHTTDRDPLPRCLAPTQAVGATRASRKPWALLAAGVLLGVGVAVIAVKLAGGDGGSEPRGAMAAPIDGGAAAAGIDAGAAPAVATATMVDAGRSAEEDRMTPGDGRASHAPPSPGGGASGGAARTPDAGTGSGGGVKLENVTIIDTADRSTAITEKADYNARTFDALAFLPRAEKLARRLLDDAKLVGFDVDGVYPAGHADLTLSDDFDALFEFRSAKASKRPDGIPRGVEVDIPCKVYVTATAREIEAVVVTDEKCKEVFRPRPRCSLAAVWTKAKGAGAPGDAVAQIDYLWDGWFVQVGDEFTESFPDDC